MSDTTSATSEKQINPLLDFSDLPRFGEIKPEHVTPALDELLAAAKAAVDHASAPDTPATWKDIVESVESASERLSRAWGVAGHLNAVADTPELRTAYGENLPRVTEFWASVGQNLALYEKYKAIAAGDEFAGLSVERKKILENSLRDFRLSGAELPEDRKPRFAQLQEEQAALSKAFSDHVLDATNAFAYIVTNESELAGLPEDVIQAAREAAQKDGRDGWKFTLHFPSYFPVMQYAEHRAAARSDVSRVCDARVRTRRDVRQRQVRVGQHRERRRKPEAARRRGAHARLPELRGSVAGAEDGGIARAGDRVPRRSRETRASARRKRLDGVARVRRH